MFLKPTKSGGHTYLQLVESYRNEAGQPRQRTVASLGRLDEVGGGVDSLLAGLLRHKGLPEYFSPSWTAFQADRGRRFSLIVDAVSAGSWTMGVTRK